MDKSASSNRPVKDSEKKANEFREGIIHGHIPADADLEKIATLLEALDRFNFKTFSIKGASLILMGMLIGVLLRPGVSEDSELAQQDGIVKPNDAITKLQQQNTDLASAIEAMKVQLAKAVTKQNLENFHSAYSSRIAQFESKVDDLDSNWSSLETSVTELVVHANQREDLLSRLEAIPLQVQDVRLASNESSHGDNAILTKNLETIQNDVSSLSDKTDSVVTMLEGIENHDAEMEVADTPIVGADRLVAIKGKPSNSVYIEVLGQRIPIWSQRWKFWANRTDSERQAAKERLFEFKNESRESLVSFSQ